MDQDTTQGVVIMMAAIYFAPAIIAIARRHLSVGAIVVLNIALGWTLIGWLVALVWSFTGNTRANTPLPPSNPKLLDRGAQSVWYALFPDERPGADRR